VTLIYRERIPSTDPRLKRHVHHDSRSRQFAFDTAGLTIRSVKHERRIPVLDQGQLGSCTGNAGIGCLGTDPFYDTLNAGVAASLRGLVGHYTLTETGAIQLYSDATRIDDYPGQYPPEDTGSDGLTIAKVLKAAGEIAGYQHTFSLDDALKALTVTPFITGTVWLDGMFTPDPDGRVHPVGAVAGGHEYVADQLDAENERIWFTNSWGTGWGVGGRFYLSFDDFGQLLAQQGDVTIFTPLSQPAPVPTPTPDADPADVALAAVAHPWVRERHTDIAGNRRMQAALKAWLKAKGL
jgi:hypothetical protein